MTEFNDGTEVRTVMFRTGEKLFQRQDKALFSLKSIVFSVRQNFINNKNYENIKPRLPLLPKLENSQDMQQGLSLQQEASSSSDMHSLKSWDIHPHGGSTNHEEIAAQSLLHGKLTPILFISTQYGDITLSSLCEGQWKWLFSMMFTHVGFDMSLAHCTLLLFSCFIYNSNNKMR